MGSGNIGLGYAEHREMQDEQKAEMQEMSVAHVLATRVGGLAQETLESVAMASAAAAKKETAIADSARQLSHKPTSTNQQTGPYEPVQGGP